MSIVPALIGGFILAVIVHALFCYVDSLGAPATWQFFERYDFESVWYWVIIILCVLDVARTLYLSSYWGMMSEYALSRVIVLTFAKLGVITACFRCMRR